MAHNLFGERYAGRKAGWHELGILVHEGCRPSEAVTLGRFNYRLSKAPLMVDLGGVQTSFGKVAIVREPTEDDPNWQVVGTASEDYTFLQNDELAERVDPLCEKWPLETIGALGKGETLFLCLDAGGYDVAGVDPIHRYFTMADKRDGQTALDLFFSGIRTQCENTLVMGKHAAVASAALMHGPTIGQELDWRLGLMRQMQEVQDKMTGSFDLMARTALEAGQADKVFAAAYPYRRQPRKLDLKGAVTEEELARLFGLQDSMALSEREWQAAKDRADERRTAANALYLKFNEDQPQLARTPWAAWNAVVEVEDFREAAGKENADEALLFGERAKAKARAFGVAMELTLGRR